jgi:hypothetical protein
VAAPDLYRLLVQPLHLAGVEYMITGAAAAIAYGEPRMTNDVDLVVRPGPDAAALLHHAFSEADYYVPPIEAIEEEIRREHSGHFNIIHNDTALRADIYLAGTDPLHAWAFGRRRSERVEGGTLWLAPIEYVIVRKLEYYSLSQSDRHLRDVSAMVRISGQDIDMAWLDTLIGDRGLRDLWQRARGSARGG